MKFFGRLRLVLCLILVLPLGAKPLLEDEKLLSDRDFATQELLKSDFDSVYFLPNNAHRALKVIRGIIAGTQKKIKAALFRLTEPSIVRALIEAHKNGIMVEVIVDPGALEAGHYSKVFDLVRAGVSVYCYVTSDLFPLSKGRQAAKKTYQTIMHLKVLCCDDIISFGSLNLTHAGFNGNVEMVEIKKSKALVVEFEDTFESLKRCSELLTLSDVPKKVKKSVSKKLPATSMVQHAVTQGVPYVRRVARMVH